MTGALQFLLQSYENNEPLVISPRHALSEVKSNRYIEPYILYGYAFNKSYDMNTLDFRKLVNAMTVARH